MVDELRDLSAQVLDLLFFIYVFVGVEDNAELDSHGALQLVLSEHLIRQINFFICRHILFVDEA